MNFLQIVVGVSIGIIAAAGTAAGAEPPTSSINFVEHVGPLLKQHCGKCHGEAVRKQGIDFSNYESALRGGAGGPVVVAGRPTRSRLLDVVTSEEPAERMPLGGDPLSAEQVALLKTWIAEGLRETAAGPSHLPEIVEFVATPPAVAATTFDPRRYADVAPPKLVRPFPVLALAAAPDGAALAVASYETIDFVDATTQARLGSLPFAEGEPHVLRFSRDGGKLLAAGGRPVQNGAARLFDTVTGKQIARLGDESDTVLAADLSPDERLVALGGTDRVVQILNTADGHATQRLVKHTDWITAVAFDPDGKWLATGDRVGNIYLWNPTNGQLTLALADHKGSIRKLAWRSDGKVLVSCSEDGVIIWWDAEKGAPMTSQADAHTRPRAPGEYGAIAGGVLDAEFGPRGELVTCGRDGAVRLWDSAGRLVQSFVLPEAASSPPTQARIMPLRVAILDDGRTIISGDSAGRLQVWQRSAAVEPR